MTMTSQSFTPYIPANEALERSVLPDKAVALSMASARLAGTLPFRTSQTLVRHMAVINSYYSNLIEGNRTQPHEIRAAQEDLLVPAIPEIVDAAMLEKSTNNTDDADRLAQAGNAGSEAADPPNDEIDLDTGLGRAVQQADHPLIDE